MSLLDNPSNALPGIGTAVLTTENEFLKGLFGPTDLIKVELASTTLDGTNTPTNELRRGLVLGQIAASTDKRYIHYAAAGTDGSNVAVGILYQSVNIKDQGGAGSAVNRIATLAIGGAVYADQLYGLDEGARAQLATRFKFLDRLYTPSGLSGWLVKTADYTVVAADNGKNFSTRGASGAVVFTLPAIGVGYRFRFVSEANQNMTVTAPANKLVVFNNLTATSVAFSTSNEKIGAVVDVISNDDGSKFIAIPVATHTATVS